MSKFAPITAGLLARKGEAGPSIVPAVKLPFVWTSERPVVETHAEIEDRPAAPPTNGEASAPRPAIEFKSGPSEPTGPAEPRGPRKPRAARGPAGPGGPHGSAERPRKISVALSPREHETLGIVAVKRGLTRHQVVRDALDSYFETLASEYRTQCSCIATGCSCAGECSAD